MSGMQSASKVSEEKRIAREKGGEKNLEDSKEFLTLMIGEQLFGIPILHVQDVLSYQPVTRIPLAPKEVAGSLNLRGRIVTAIDIRTRLGYEKKIDKEKKPMSIVVSHDENLYSFIVDKIGDVMILSNSDFEKTLTTLDPIWKEISNGIYRLKDDLLVVLDVARLLKSVYPDTDSNEVE